MELNQLNYFRTVARLQNVTKAAEELYISQPNLSTAITKLESSLGAIKERTEYTEDRIVAGSVFGGLLDKLFVAYFADYGLLPNGQFVYNNALLERMVVEKTLDFAIMNRRPENPELEWFPLFGDSLAAAMLPENAHSHESILDLSQLRSDHFICNETLFDKESTDALCKEADFVPNVVRVYNQYEFPGPEVLDFGKNLIIHPLFFSHSFVERYGKSVVIKRFANHFCRTEIGLVRLKAKSISPLSEDFFEYIRAEMPAMLTREREVSEALISVY